MVTANYQVTAGGYPSEISWELSCSDGTALNGGAAFPLSTMIVPDGTTCTLTMLDSYGDGWNNAMFYACTGGPYTTLVGNSDCGAGYTFTSGSVAHANIVFASGAISSLSQHHHLLLSLFWPSSDGTVTATIEVSGGVYPGEVSWDITCSDGAAASGGAPYPLTDFTLTLGATCTLSMQDSYGDGWNGATWTSCITAPGGECASITLPAGSIGQETMVVSLGESSPDSSPDPGLSPSPSSPSSTPNTDPSPGPSSPSPDLDGSSVAATLQVTSGSYDSEVSWEVTCSDGAAASGGAPYPLTDFTLTLGATCTLSMLDSYGDGWNGATWIACVTAPGGECSSITLPTGSVGQETVVISVGEASPSPSSPSSTPNTDPSPGPSSPSPDLDGSSVAATLQVTSGTYDSEVSWEVTCSDGAAASGGAPYPLTDFTLTLGATCTLSMLDSVWRRLERSHLDRVCHCSWR